LKKTTTTTTTTTNKIYDWMCVCTCAFVFGGLGKEGRKKDEEKREEGGRTRASAAHGKT
jgi:hypothetical protein